MTANTDPDLAGDSTFEPTPGGVDFVIQTAGGPAFATAMTIPAEGQANQNHNRLRYAELEALRLGLPNRYSESRYR